MPEVRVIRIESVPCIVGDHATLKKGLHYHKFEVAEDDVVVYPCKKVDCIDSFACSDPKGKHEICARWYRVINEPIEYDCTCECHNEKNDGMVINQE